MSTALAAASAGLVVAGPVGAIVGAYLSFALTSTPRRKNPQLNTRLLLVVLLVEVRSGLSILAAMQTAARMLPGHPGLRRVTRVATVSGLASALTVADRELRPLLAQLARAQVSGAPISAALRSMLDRDLARERTERVAIARSLPVRLMLPVTLLMLPGLVLLLYAPSLLGLFEELTGAWT